MRYSPKTKMRPSMYYELTDKTLYSVCEDVEQGEDISQLINAMKRIMVDGGGCGLAANQIGSNKRVIVISVPGTGITVINPVVKLLGKQHVPSMECCLSFPGQQALIMRHHIVEISGYAEGWKPIEDLRLLGKAAITTQHEVDHLNAITCMEKSDGGQVNINAQGA